MLTRKFDNVDLDSANTGVDPWLEEWDDIPWDDSITRTASGLEQFVPMIDSYLSDDVSDLSMSISMANDSQFLPKWLDEHRANGSVMSKCQPQSSHHRNHSSANSVANRKQSSTQSCRRPPPRRDYASITDRSRNRHHGSSTTPRRRRSFRHLDDSDQIEAKHHQSRSKHKTSECHRQHNSPRRSSSCKTSRRIRSKRLGCFATSDRSSSNKSYIGGSTRSLSSRSLGRLDLDGDSHVGRSRRWCCSRASNGYVDDDRSDSKSRRSWSKHRSSYCYGSGCSSHRKSSSNRRPSSSSLGNLGITDHGDLRGMSSSTHKSHRPMTRKGRRSPARSFSPVSFGEFGSDKERCNKSQHSFVPSHRPSHSRGSRRRKSRRHSKASLGELYVDCVPSDLEDSFGFDESPRDKRSSMKRTSSNRSLTLMVASMKVSSLDDRMPQKHEGRKVTTRRRKSFNMSLNS